MLYSKSDINQCIYIARSVERVLSDVRALMNFYYRDMGMKNPDLLWGYTTKSYYCFWRNNSNLNTLLKFSC